MEAPEFSLNVNYVMMDGVKINSGLKSIGRSQLLPAYPTTAA
jgi:hypothetical protein